MSNCGRDPENCGKCKRAGLPILLTRYAIAPRQVGDKGFTTELWDSKVQKLPEQFSPAGQIDLGKSADYTLRTLRQGYVYMYDQARKGNASKGWKAYYVNNDGFLTQFPFPKEDWTKSATNDEDDKPPCNAANYATSRSITIDFPVEEATYVYFAFSDVEWTEEIFEQVVNGKDNAGRMTVFDVRKWLTEQKYQHAAPISELGKLVVEFNLEVVGSTFNFSTSPVKEKTKAADLSPVVESAFLRINSKVPGAIVALNDPVGIAIDLAELMNRREMLFTKANEQKLKAAARISSIQKAVIESEVIKARKKTHGEALNKLQQEMDKQYAMRNKTRQEAYSDMLKVYKGKAQLTDFITLTPAINSEYERLGTASEGTIQHKCTEVWDSYLERLEDKGTSLRAFEHEYSKRFNFLQENFITPLAEAHAKWIDSPLMKEYFQYYFDPEAKEHGSFENAKAYHVLFFKCVSNTQVREPCVKVYERWLSSDPYASDNLLMRALFYNRNDFVLDIKKATAAMEKIMENVSLASKNVSDLKEEEVQLSVGNFDADHLADLEKLFKRFQDDPIFKALGGVNEGKTSWFDNAVARILSPSTRSGTGPDRVSKEVMVLLGAHNEKLIIPVILGSTQAETLKHMVDSLGTFSGQKLVGAEDHFLWSLANLRDKHQINLTARGNHTLYAEMPRDLLKEIMEVMKGKKLDANQQTTLAKKIAACLRFDTLGRIRFTVKNNAVIVSWQSRVHQAMLSAKNPALVAYRNGTFVARRVKVAQGVVSIFGLVASIWSIGSIREQIAKDNKDTWQTIAAYTGLAAVALSAVSSAAALAEVALTILKPSNVRGAESFSRLSRYTGIAAAFLFAVLDIKSGLDAGSMGNTQLAGAYFVAGGLGFASMGYLASAGPSPIGLTLLVATILASWFIIEYSDNSYQEWLRKCPFGTANKDEKHDAIKADLEWNELQRKAEASKPVVTFILPEEEGAY